MSKILRTVKNVVKNYTPAEVKARNCTSNDPWFPSTSELEELARYTFHEKSKTEILGIIFKRLTDSNKNYMHVLKSLISFEYLCFFGHESVYKYICSNHHLMANLTSFTYIDKEGNDKGHLVRERAKRVKKLIDNTSFYKTEKERATASKESSYRGTNSGGSYRGIDREPYSPRSNLRSNVEYAPKSKEEEDIQLKIALALSKQEAETFNFGEKPKDYDDTESHSSVATGRVQPPRPADPFSRHKANLSNTKSSIDKPQSTKANSVEFDDIFGVSSKPQNAADRTLSSNNVFTSQSSGNQGKVEFRSTNDVFSNANAGSGYQHNFRNVQNSDNNLAQHNMQNKFQANNSTGFNSFGFPQNSNQDLNFSSRNPMNRPEPTPSANSFTEMNHSTLEGVNFTSPNDGNMAMLNNPQSDAMKFVSQNPNLVDLSVDKFLATDYNKVPPKPLSLNEMMKSESSGGGSNNFTNSNQFGGSNDPFQSNTYANIAQGPSSNMNQQMFSNFGFPSNSQNIHDQTTNFQNQKSTQGFSNPQNFSGSQFNQYNSTSDKNQNNTNPFT